MCALIRLELHKLVRQKPFWITLIVLLILILESYLGWVNPGGSNFHILTKDGTRLSGRSAIMQDRQYSEQYRGILTDDRVKQIFENERYNEAQIEEQIKMVETSSTISSYASSVSRLVGYYFLNTERAYSGELDMWRYHYGEEELLPIAEVFAESAMPLYYEYSVQWGGAMESVITSIFLLNILLFLGVSPVFSEERARKMNALLFTSKFGRWKCFWAKTAAAYVIGIGLVLGMILLIVSATLMLFGTEGLRCSIQLVEPFLYQDCPVAKTLGMVFVDAALLSTAGIFFTISLTILASVLAKNSLHAAILSLALFALPVIVRIFQVSDAIKLIAPVNRMFDFSGTMAVPDVSLGNIRIAYSHAAAGILMIGSAVIILCAGAFYQRHAAE